MAKKRRARSVLAAILATLEGGGDNLQCSRPGWVSAVTKQSPMVVAGDGCAVISLYPFCSAWYVIGVLISDRSIR